MPRQQPSLLTDHSEEGRAFFQTRVALFWRVIFFIILIGSGLGVIGAVKEPGFDLVLTMAATANAGIFWWLCRTGERCQDSPAIMRFRPPRPSTWQTAM
jgi:hypothetical protein